EIAVVERERIALAERDWPGRRLGEGPKVDGEKLALRSDPFGGVERPRSRRGTEVEHALPFFEEADLAIDRFELEHAARGKAALFGLLREAIGPLVRIGAPGHRPPALLRLGLAALFLDGAAHGDEPVARAGDAALDEQQMLLGDDLGDLQVQHADRLV